MSDDKPGLWVQADYGWIEFKRNDGTRKTYQFDFKAVAP